ncbi:hypothetical protein OPV22_013960 [Ensete ventricosum]|uniref:Uncharacterized protein n=1 Tax=Ensete ventricosum TaxID=4639 RepID=A0AAV8R278_ENSVE|nr:hypothetical protein OPV22_013960 [Ensete ventricosum]
MVALGQRKKMVTTKVMAVVGSSSTEGWEAMTEEVGMVDCEELRQRYSGWRRAKEGAVEGDLGLVMVDRSLAISIGVFRSVLG